MLVFVERGKLEYPEKNLSEQRREPNTNSTHIWRLVRESNPGPNGCAIPAPLKHFIHNEPSHNKVSTVLSTVLMGNNLPVSALTKLYLSDWHNNFIWFVPAKFQRGMTFFNNCSKRRNIMNRKMLIYLIGYNCNGMVIHIQKSQYIESEVNLFKEYYLRFWWSNGISSLQNEEYSENINQF